MLDTGCWIIGNAPTVVFRTSLHPETSIQDQSILPMVFITRAFIHFISQVGPADTAAFSAESQRTLRRL